MPEIIPVITIDGPGGTGKGTASQLIAQHLGWHLLDSGVLYRALAMAAEKRAISIDDEASLQVLAEYLDVEFKASENKHTRARILLEGEDVSDEIRTDIWADKASKVAAISLVRTALLKRQHAFRQAPGLVADGRDMGTIVFPNATLKFYLDASVDVRAKRRYSQLKDKGINVTLEEITTDLMQRDHRDSHRSVAPLKPATDAIIIDTSNLYVEQVIDTIMVEINAHADLVVGRSYSVD